MKRSEMVFNIVNEICNHEPISRKNKNIESSAEWILKKLEEDGMLPPYNPQHLDHGAMQDCQWDPEEEITDEELSKL